MIDPHKLHAYADGQATPEEVAEIEARVASCTATQGELAAIRSFKACVARHPYQHDHSECWKASVGRLNEIDRAARTERFVGKYAWAFASGVVALVILTGVARQESNTPTMRTADLAGIMSQLGTGNRKTVDPREQKLAQLFLDRSKLVLEDRRLEVVAMSEAVFDGMLVRRMTLRDGRGHLALLDLPAEAQIEGLEPISGTSMQSGRLGEFDCVVWPSGSRTLVLVGERDPADLAKTASQVHESR